MAGAGYKLFNTGDVLTAAQVNTYLQEQTVMVFASSTARTTALSGVLAEGMVSYLQDTNAVEVYNGSAWVGVSGAGDVTEVQAGTGISVASGTGPIPVVTNTMATAIDAKGDLVVGTGADSFARLAVGGTNGHSLQVDSSTATGLKWAAASSGALTFITGTTFSAVASFSLPNNTFTATYDNYLVRLQLTDASAASAVTLKLRAGGVDTSTNYYSAQTRLDYLLASTSLGENATTSWGLGSINIGGNNQQIFQYDLDIKQPFNTKHTMVNAAGSLGNIVSSVGLLAKVDLTSYDSLTFACSTGTITGNYRVYGYQNS